MLAIDRLSYRTSTLFRAKIDGCRAVDRHGRLAGEVRLSDGETAPALTDYRRQGTDTPCSRNEEI